MTLPHSTYDPDKGYTDIIFRDDRDLLNTELNELQDLTNEKFRLANDVNFKEGGRLEGAEIVIKPHPTDATKVRCNITRGKIYFRGLVRVIPASFVDVPKTGQHNIGIKLTEVEVTATDPVSGDPTLVHPQTGDLVAERLRPAYEWVVDDASSTRVFTLRNGDQIINDLPPDLNAAEVLDIRRTIDLVGNCLVYGGQSHAIDVDAETFKVITTPLKAYVEGRELVLPSPRETIVGKALSTVRIMGETFVYQPATASYVLASNPIKEVVALRAQVQKTTNITKGVTNGVDVLPFAPVTSVVSVTQGPTTYVAGVDYQRNGNQIDWSLGGAEPTPGSTYTVTLIYTKTMIKDTDYKVNLKYNVAKQYYYDIDFTLGGDDPVTGSSFEVDYDIYISRRDVLCLDKDGELVLLPGMPKDINPFPPAVPEHMLKLCDIAIPAGPDFENIRVVNADNYVLSALEIRQFLKRFENLEYNMALEDLDKEVLQNEQVTNKRGIFTDPFTNSNKGDLYRRLADPTAGPTLVTTNSGGTLAQNTTYYFKYAWGNKNGATLPSPASQITTANNSGNIHKVTVYLPEAPVNATRAYVYMSTTGVADPNSYRLVAELYTHPIETEPEKNMVWDHGFEGNFPFDAGVGGVYTSKRWVGVLSGTAAGTTPFVLEKTSGMIDGKVTLKTNVTNGGTLKAHVLVYNNGGGKTKAVTTSQKWRMTFKAKCASGTVAADFVPMANAAGNDLATVSSITITTTPQTFTADFTPTTNDTAARYGIIKVGNTTTNVYIDEVKAYKLTEFVVTAPPAGDALEVNTFNTAFEFTAAYGLHEGIVCNGIFKYPFDLALYVDLPNTTAVKGRHYWHLPYTLIESVNQPKATTTMPVNPYEVYNRATLMTLFPAEDQIPEVNVPPVTPPQPIKFPCWYSSCEWNNLKSYQPQIQPDTLIRVMTGASLGKAGNQLLFESPWKEQGADLIYYTMGLKAGEAPKNFDTWYDKANNIITINVGKASGAGNPTTWINNFKTVEANKQVASTGTLPSAGQQNQTQDKLQPFIRVREVEITGKRFIANSVDLHAFFAGVPVDLTPVAPTTAGTDWQDPRTNRFYKTVNADVNGNFKAKFTIPEGIPTGDRDVLVENALNKGITVYKADGKWMQRINQEVQIGEATNRFGMFNRFTPVAQSFQYDSDRIIAKVGVAFRQKSTENAPITLQIRNMVNGEPGTEVLATSTLEASEVSISTDGSAITEFPLDDILWVKANTQYCFVLITDSIEYLIWIAELGMTDVATNQPVSTNPYVGVLFSSSNNTAWTAHQAADMKFKIWECEFSTPKVLQFENLTDFEAATFFLSMSAIFPPNTYVDWYMSTDDGANYYQIQPMVETFYGMLATQAKVKAILRTDDIRLTPFINGDSLTLNNFVWYSPTVYISKNIDYSQFNVTYDVVRSYLYEKVPPTGDVEVWITHDDTLHWFKMDDDFTRNIDGAWKDEERIVDYGTGNPRDQFRIMIKFITADGLMPACVGRLRTVQMRQHP